MALNTDKSVYIKIEGIKNESSDYVLRDFVLNKRGVKNFSFDFKSNHAIVEYNGDADILPTMVREINLMGYNVKTKSAGFKVENMTCASCALNIESFLKSKPGVLNAYVSYGSEKLTIELIEDVISSEELKICTKSIGYELFDDNEIISKDVIDGIKSSKLLTLKKNTLGAVILSLPVFIIGMFFMNMPYANFVMWALATPVIFWFGKTFFSGAWQQIRIWRANMDTLVALSTGVAYFFSVFNTLNPSFWVKKGLHAHVYFEASAIIIAFILIGKLIEERAKGNTKSALKKLMGLQPKDVTVIHDNGLVNRIPIEQIKIGDTIIVKPGEKIAVDGIVIHGNSFVNESLLTGEPLPVLKETNSKVFAGTINQKGSLKIIAGKVGKETILAQIIKTVDDAQGSKAPSQKLADKIASVFVPAIIVIAIISFTLWLSVGRADALLYAIISFITVLIIACPCALGLATPTAIMVGIGKGAENGILIKNAECLENFKKVNALILDKTGTITEGKPVVTDIYWVNLNKKEEQVLAAIESHSEHPLADAIVNHLKIKDNIQLTHFESVTGKGVKAIYNNEKYLVGGLEFLTENGVYQDLNLNQLAIEWTKQMKTVVWFASSNKPLAIIAITDKIKSTAKIAIQEINNMGIDVYMLTGDNENTAKAIASQLGIKNFKSALLPNEKADFVKDLQKKGKIVAMVGDGINDSSALAFADVSIAMGHGSDIAIDAAKMTIISSDLSKLPLAFKISEQTVNTIKENLFWAFFYNSLGIPIAAGVLFPLTGFLLNPMVAGAAMAFSSISVVANSLRLKHKNINNAKNKTFTKYESDNLQAKQITNDAHNN